MTPALLRHNPPHSFEIDQVMVLQAAVKEFAPQAAERVYVGKRGGQKSIAQTEIDDLLVEHCRQVCPPSCYAIRRRKPLLHAADAPLA